MKIFFNDMHNSIVKSFAEAFNCMGFELYLAGKTFDASNASTPTISYGRKWTQEEINIEIALPNVFVMEADELMSNPPDVYMIMCAEQQRDMIAIWNKIKNPKTKLVWYSGNDNTAMYYDKMLCQNVITADIGSYAYSLVENKNLIYYFPWIDYKTFTFQGISDEKIIRSYIINYKNLFPQGWRLANETSEKFKELDVTWEPIIDPVPKNETPNLMKNSIATLHLKELEGYGYAIAESLACGRPIILFTPFSKNRSFSHWCIDNKSAFYFTNLSELEYKLSKFINDDEYRYDIQKTSAETVREIINNDEQTEKLKKYLEELF